MCFTVSVGLANSTKLYRRLATALLHWGALVRAPPADSEQDELARALAMSLEGAHDEEGSR